jgi:outer membrane protein assembly factor BamB
MTKKITHQQPFIQKLWKLFLTMIVITAFSFPMLAQNSWTQFRGEMRDGKSPETGLLEKWPNSGPDLVWKKETGPGFPELLIQKDIFFLLSSDTTGDAHEFIAAYDLNAKELWKVRVDSMYYEVDGWGHGPRSTPALDEERIYCFSGSGKLAAYSISDGKEVWTRNIPEDYGCEMPRWGYTSSPILVENILILETGGTEKRAFTAFNPKTGAQLWSKGIGTTSYSSPAIAKIDGTTNIVFANDTMLHSYNTNGEALWSFRMPMRYPTPMPVFIAPNKFFMSNMGRTGSFIIAVENNEAKEILQSKTMQNNFNTSCYHKGYLYGITRTKLMCVSAETGKLKWTHRGFGAGSLIIVDGKLLVLSDQGKLTMVEATPKSYKELGSVKALEGKSWTAPSFANGRIYVRNLTHMACYNLKK